MDLGELAKRSPATLYSPEEISSLRHSLLEASSSREALDDAVRTSDPQRLLDDFQFLLDRESDSSEVHDVTSERARLIKALVHLSVVCKEFPASLRVARAQRDGDPIDFGIAGEIYRGHFADREVAIKVFKVYKKRQQDLPMYIKAIRTEAILWCQLYHANILPCYGAYCDPTEALRIEILSPWMRHGNVATYLRSEENSRHPINRLLFISDIASGMAYLHGMGIIHGDLRAANVLVSGSRRACLGDFGISTIPDVPGWESPRKMRAPGAPRWHAPELLDPRDGVEIKTTPMSDVYSFGCVCYEIMAERVPFHETRNETRTQLRILRGDNPRRPSSDEPAFQRFGLTAGLWDLMKSCWSKEPRSRPTAKQLCENELLSTLPDERPPQGWGGASIAEIRNFSAPPPRLEVTKETTTMLGRIAQASVSQRPSSQVDGFEELARAIEAIGETDARPREVTARDGNDSVTEVRTLLLQVCTSLDMQREILRLSDGRAEKWMNTLQMVLDSDPSNTQGGRGRLLEGLIRLAIVRGSPPTALRLRAPVEEEVEPVDMGPSGELYRGRIPGRTVAIKVLRTFRGRNRVDFKKLMLNEAVISCNLQHANILPCYGVYSPHWQAGQVALVSPWMDNGNVRDYLRKNPRVDRLLLVYDVLSGLVYLHKNNIVHGDLEGGNILISSSGRACLANFSLSILSNQGSTGSPTDLIASGVDFGAVRWQAPELLADLDDEKITVTPASDIYSFGCVCYEVMTGKMPFYQKRKILAIPDLVLVGTRPRWPDPGDIAYQEYGLTDELCSCVGACWKEDAHLRPTAQELSQIVAFSFLLDLRPTR